MVGRLMAGKCRRLLNQLGQKVSSSVKRKQPVTVSWVLTTDGAYPEAICIRYPENLHIEEKRAINRLMNQVQQSSSIGDVELVIFVIEEPIGSMTKWY